MLKSDMVPVELRCQYCGKEMHGVRMLYHFMSGWMRFCECAQFQRAHPKAFLLLRDLQNGKGLNRNVILKNR